MRCEASRSEDRKLDRATFCEIEMSNCHEFLAGRNAANGKSGREKDRCLPSAGAMT